jgi:hypothetical protein
MLVPLSGSAGNLAVDGTYVWYTDQAGTAYRAPMSGGSPLALPDPSHTPTSAIAVDSLGAVVSYSTVLSGNDGPFGRSSTSGSTWEVNADGSLGRELLTTDVSPCALSPTELFFAELDGIKRVLR